VNFLLKYHQNLKRWSTKKERKIIEKKKERKEEEKEKFQESLQVKGKSIF
jgi:hypothetical protein